MRARRPRPFPLVALGLIAAGCGRSPPPRAPVVPVDAAPPPAVERVTAVRTGIASSYAPSLAGRPTASGEPYDGSRLTAAHRTLPLGTKLRVTRIDRRGRAKSPPVEVTVNDRGPYEVGRVIDLSESAARRLGIEGTVGRVRIEVIRRVRPGASSKAAANQAGAK